MNLYNMVNIMKNKSKYLSISILTLTTAAIGTGLASPVAFADTTGSKPASVIVASACTFTSQASASNSLSLFAGGSANTESNQSKTEIVVSCNNPNGFALQAVGMAPTHDSPSEMVEGATALYNATDDISIPTGASGTDSYWSFKVSRATVTAPYTITPAYSTYNSVPSQPTSILTVNATSSPIVIGIIRTDYQVYASTTQPSGAYTGAVKYTILPNA